VSSSKLVDVEALKRIPGIGDRVREIESEFLGVKGGSPQDPSFVWRAKLGSDGGWIRDESQERWVSKTLDLRVGDVMEFIDYWVEAERANTLCTARWITARIVHLAGSRWGVGVRFVVLKSPDGDSMPPGTEGFRWGESIEYAGCRGTIRKVESR
jgi:hypothetical protein